MNNFYRVLLLCLTCSTFAGTGPKTQTNIIDGLSTNKRAAPTLVDDRAFIRRAMLDLAGRLPTSDQVGTFLANTNPAKRSELVEEIMASEAYVHRWTTFFEDLFGIRMLLDEAEFRNPFHFQIMEMVANNTSWDQMARTFLTGSGLGTAKDSSFLFWAMEALDSDFRLDYLDDQIGFISENLLGLRLNCISCHDGAYHLEEINKGLSVMKREQFWGLAAFLSQSFVYLPNEWSHYENDDGELFYAEMQYRDQDEPGFERGDGFFLAEYQFYDGEYNARSEAGQGMRSPRFGGVTSPVWLNGEGPQSGETRRAALARLLTQDRQFARNMVNRIWAHFFGTGFVEPLDGWDLGRIDAASAASFETTVQARSPRMMEALTTYFIQQDYDLKALIRLVTNSEAYQWDYLNAPHNGSGEIAYWRGNHRVRRIEAEAVVDSVFQLLGMERRYTITGVVDRTWNTTWAMPDTYEPNIGALYNENYDGFQVHPRTLGYESADEYNWMQYGTMDMLNGLGNGNRFEGLPRISETDIQNSLLMLNKEDMNIWLEEWATPPLVAYFTNLIDTNQATEEQVVFALSQYILFRDPTEQERDQMAAYFQGKEVRQAVADITWALLNHPDFLYK